MNEWVSVWLAIIAIATLAMAVIQVGVLVNGARIARQMEALLGKFEHDVKPVLDHARQVSAEAARMSALATAQVERVDQLFTQLGQRVDQTAAVIQQAIVVPAKESASLVAALRSTVMALKGLRRGRRSGPPRGVEEDDALFIG